MGFTVYWSRQPVLNSVFERFKTLLPDMLEHSTVQSSVSEVILVPTDDTNQHERFWTRDGSSREAFVKTSRTPYTTDVMRACILMVELNMVSLNSLSNDDESAFSWLEQLQAVNRHFPLQSYEEQAKHFLQKELTGILDSVPLHQQVEVVQALKNVMKSFV